MKNSKPFLSIIVPAYNVEKYVGKCIESILGQEYSDFELILVDDGSTDKTGNICDKYSQMDERIRVIHKMNGGLVSARKAGLEVSRGEYVGCVDGDDWIANEMFTDLCGIATETKADIVISDFVYVWENKNNYLSQNLREGLYDKEKLLNEVYPFMICGNNYFSFGLQPSLCSKIIKKQILLDNQFDVDNRIRLGEDAACFYPCMMSADSVYYLKNKYYYYYRMRNSSISHSIHNSFYSDEIIILIEHLKKKICGDPDITKVLENQLWLYAGYMFDNMISPHLKFKELFINDKLQKELDKISSTDIGQGLIKFCENVRTSSRMKRIVRCMQDDKFAAKLELFLFVQYEKLRRII